MVASRPARAMRAFPVGTASVPAVDPRKAAVGLRCGQLVMDILRRGLRKDDRLGDGPTDPEAVVAERLRQGRAGARGVGAQRCKPTGREAARARLLVGE